MDKFFTSHTKRKPPEDEPSPSPQPAAATNIPKGVVLGKDGKPCRTCTSSADWAAMMKATTASKSSSNSSSTSPSSLTSPSTTTSTYPTDCPPTSDILGTHTWTLLHSISASYPPSATPTQQSEMRSFLHLFARLYPCWTCASDFQAWMAEKENEPRVEGREGLGRWMCEAHNEVNRKLGKGVFDCGRWEERWRTGCGGGD